MMMFSCCSVNPIYNFIKLVPWRKYSLFCPCIEVICTVYEFCFMYSFSNNNNNNKKATFRVVFKVTLNHCIKRNFSNYVQSAYLPNPHFYKYFLIILTEQQILSLYCSWKPANLLLLIKLLKIYVLWKEEICKT